MLLIVLVKNELYASVKNVAVDTVGTGIMGKMVSGRAEKLTQIKFSSIAFFCIYC